MSDAANLLLQALDSVSESMKFSTSGSLAPVIPGLEVQGVGPVGLPINPAIARQLIEHASQAPYGKGEETIVDTNVRRVWQIEPKQFTLGNPEWEPFLAGIVENVKKEFGIKGRIDCDLYKLLIYEPGSFFAPHRDTEKQDGMFATLVVSLPSRHAGGTLLVTHDATTREIDFGGDTGAYAIQYAAFYADCRHEIKPVTEGYRVTLVYNLSLAERKKQPTAPRNTSQLEQAVELLPQLFADDSRTKAAILLKHEYSEAGLGLDRLKGGDRTRVAVLMQAAEQLGYNAFLALMTYRQSGYPDEGTVGYSRWGEVVDSDDAEMEEVFDEELSLDHWIDARGQKQPFGKMDLHQDEIVSATAFEDLPFKQEVTEATGNEGASMERWYHSAAVVVWPPERYFRILAGQGQDSAVPALAERVAQAKDPAKSEECRIFAGEIIGHWKPVPEYGRISSSQSAVLLNLLAKIDNSDLINRFIREVLVQDYQGNEGETLAELANKGGWKTFAQALVHFVSSQSPESRETSLENTASIVAALCCSPGKMTAERKAVCRSLVGELENLLPRWDRTTHYWQEKVDRERVLESLIRACDAVDLGETLERVIAGALADNAHYDLHKVLIPLVQKMHQWKSPGPVVKECFQKIREHCIGELEARTAKPIEPPKDWAQNIKLSCRCADCKELQQFLQDPVQQVHRFRVAEQRRKHLHQQIDGQRCDMTHATERTGSPYTLVCTKNRASYDRKTAEFNTNVNLLTELRGMTEPKQSKRPKKGK